MQTTEQKKWYCRTTIENFMNIKCTKKDYFSPGLQYGRATDSTWPKNDLRPMYYETTHLSPAKPNPYSIKIALHILGALYYNTICVESIPGTWHAGRDLAPRFFSGNETT